MIENSVKKNTKTPYGVSVQYKVKDHIHKP